MKNIRLNHLSTVWRISLYTYFIILLVGGSVFLPSHPVEAKNSIPQAQNQPTLNLDNPTSITIIGTKVFENVFENGDALFFCEYNLVYTVLPTESPVDAYTLSLLSPSNAVLVSRGLFAYGYNFQCIYLTKAQVGQVSLSWRTDDYSLRISPNPFYLAPVEDTNQKTQPISTDDWISSANVAQNDTTNSTFSFYLINLFKRMEVGQGLDAGYYATVGTSGEPTLTPAGRAILLEAVPFLDSMMPNIFTTAISDINVTFADTNSSTNLQSSINTQKILGDTFATEKTNISNWMGISENSAGGLVAFFIMALMFGISFYVIRDIPSAMIMTFTLSIILTGVGLIPVNLMFALVIIAATYMLFLVWRFVF